MLLLITFELQLLIQCMQMTSQFQSTENKPCEGEFEDPLQRFLAPQEFTDWQPQL